MAEAAPTTAAPESDRRPLTKFTLASYMILVIVFALGAIGSAMTNSLSLFFVKHVSQRRPTWRGSRAASSPSTWW